jgi:hypothetical protein
MSATTATAPMMPRARPTWQPERQDPAETNGLEPVESSEDLRPWKIARDVFIWTSLQIRRRAISLIQKGSIEYDLSPTGKKPTLRHLL